MKQNIVVYKISENLRGEIINFYRDRFSDNKPPYSVFQVKDYDCTITLYESGKIMFQGIGADIEASYWTEQERIRNKRDVMSEIKDKQNKKDKENNVSEDMSWVQYKGENTIGSDEVGTGDYFGPIIVSASYVDKAHMSLLNTLGVRDSKKLTDDKIIEIAPTLIKEIPHETLIYSPSDYNRINITNMNVVKAILHNKTLTKLILKEYPYEAIVIDQFCPPNKFYKHIEKMKVRVKNVVFTTHAEDKFLSVAASSIISRYIFLKEMDRMSKELGMKIPKGASNEVDKFGVEVVNKYGINKLNDLVKLNFKNTDKIKELLQTK